MVPHPLYEFHKNAKLSDITYADDLVQTCAGPTLVASVSVSPCECCLVDLVGHVLLVSAIPSDSYSLSSPLPWGSQSLRIGTQWRILI